METFYFLEKALLSLNKEEFKRFEKFLHSPYFYNNHTNNKVMQKLFKLTKPLITGKCKFKEFDWGKAAKKVTTNKSSLTKSCVSKLKSELLNYLIFFFNIENLKKDRLFCKISILDELSNPGSG